MTENLHEVLPAVIAERSREGLEPDFVIQRYSPEARVWRNWDCAYTRVEAGNLLAVYTRRHRAEGLDWRVARIVYVPPKQALHDARPEPLHREELPA